MGTIEAHSGDALIAEYERLENAVRQTVFPRLFVDEVEDDGETSMGLRCPRCGTLATADNLAAVDRSTRWNYASEPDDDAFDHRRITFNGEGDDHEETLYYLHNDSHAVSLPDGWTEDWT